MSCITAATVSSSLAYVGSVSKRMFAYSRVQHEQRRRGPHGRQRQQHVAGQAVLRRSAALHHAGQLDAPAGSAGPILSRTSARSPPDLALDEHSGDKQPDVEHVDAVGHVAQRILDLQAEVLLVEDAGELRAGGIGHLPCEMSCIRAGQRVTGPQCLAEQLKHVRQLIAIELVLIASSRGAGRSTESATPTMADAIPRRRRARCDAEACSEHGERDAGAGDDGQSHERLRGADQGMIGLLEHALERLVGEAAACRQRLRASSAAWLRRYAGGSPPA